MHSRHTKTVILQTFDNSWLKYLSLSRNCFHRGTLFETILSVILRTSFAVKDQENEAIDFAYSHLSPRS